MNRESRIALAYAATLADVCAWFWLLATHPQHAALASITCTIIGIGCLLVADRERWK